MLETIHNTIDSKVLYWTQSIKLYESKTRSDHEKYDLFEIMKFRNGIALSIRYEIES